MEFECVKEVVKVCMVGESGVGKSSIAVRFVQDTFYPNLHPTLGVGYLTRSITDGKGACYKFQIWDTAGQERYRSLVPIYYQGAAVILIVFDVTNRESLVFGATRWIQELRKVGPSEALYVLVGNKADFGANDREVSELEGHLKAKEAGALYFETSAKSGYNVNELFKVISHHLDDTRLFGLTGQTKLTVPAEKSHKSSSNKVSSFCRQFSSKFRLEAYKQHFTTNSTSESGCCGKS